MRTARSLTASRSIREGMCGRGVCMAGGVWWGVRGRVCVLGGGVHGREACMAEGRGHAWQRGACMAEGGMHGRECVVGACVAGGGGVHGRGHAWQGVWHACPPPMDRILGTRL